MIGKRKLLFLSAAAIFAAALVSASVLLLNWLRDNRLPAFNSDVELFVYPDMGSDDVAARLISDSVLKWPSRITPLFEKHGVTRFLKPGHYVIPSDSPAVLLARTLNNGWQTPVKFTLSGSLRSRGEVARRISCSLMLDSAAVRMALDDEKLLSKYGVTPATVYSIMMPDTYEVWWTASMEDILDKQCACMNAFWTEDNCAKANALGLSRLQVSTLASIVNAETNCVPEMPLVAGVYLNRLRKGMKLQADPTIAYCHDYKVNRILRKMLSVDSPYNTYKYAGLPPGPICIPSRSALNAVLNPDYGKGNLFFCADPSLNGRHRFTPSYAEHRRNARAFSRALDEAAEKK